MGAWPPTVHQDVTDKIDEMLSGLPAQIRAQVEAMLVEGTNIDLAPSGLGATRQLTVTSTGGGSSTNTGTGVPGLVLLDSFTGTSDTEKYAAALAHCAAQTTPPVLGYSNRTYSLSLSANGGAPWKMFHGLKQAGPPGANNAEVDSNLRVTCRVNVSASGTVFFDMARAAAGDYLDSITMQNISWDGTATTSLLGGTGVMHVSLFRDLAMTNFKHVFGNPTKPLSTTAIVADGYWNTNGIYNVAYTMAGSDNTMWMDGHLIDSSFDGATATTDYFPGGSSLPHVLLTYFAMSEIGPLYITGEGLWQPLKVVGSGYNSNPSGQNSGGPIVFHGGRYEGRNPGRPTMGAAIMNDGGHIKMLSPWIANAMSDPVAAGRGELGVVHTKNGGMTTLIAPTYQKTTTPAIDEALPFVYATADSYVRIYAADVLARRYQWVDPRPRVRHLDTSKLINDASVIRV